MIIPGSVERDPASLTVSVNKWATFNCTVCLERNGMKLKWRLEVPNMGEMDEHYHKSIRLLRYWEGKGINMTRNSSRGSSTDCRKVTFESIEILATSQMDGAIIQCAAIGTRKNLRSSYSKFAILHLQEPDSQEASNELLNLEDNNNHRLQ